LLYTGFRKSAAWSSSLGDYRDEEEDENEDAFQKFGGSLYKDDSNKKIKTNSDPNSINMVRNRAKITNPKVSLFLKGQSCEIIIVFLVFP
jgi:hypothetical protein